MIFKIRVTNFCAVLGILIISLSLLAQEASDVTMQLANKMEQAKTVKAVVSVLREIPKEVALVDRLVIYDRTPKNIVDTEQLLEIVSRHIQLQPDAAYAAELIFALSLDGQNKRFSMSRKDRNFIRDLFFDSMMEWRNVVQAETEATPIEVGESSDLSERVQGSFNKRSISFAQALAEGMSVEQRTAFLKLEEKFRKRNASDMKEAVSQVPRVNGSKNQIYYSLGIPAAIVGSGSATIMGAMHIFSMDYSVQTLIYSLAEMVMGAGITLASPIVVFEKGSENAKVRKTEIKHVTSYYEKRTKMLDAFFGEIKSNLPACAVAVNFQRKSAK